MAFQRAVAAALSLSSIMTLAQRSSWAVSSRPSSSARSSRAARMSTLTMLAVAKARSAVPPVPAEAVVPVAGSSTATAACPPAPSNLPYRLRDRGAHP